MKKIVVHYKVLHKCTVGGVAFVEPIDHPSALVSNTTVSITSIVEQYDRDTGIFETQNTIYKPQ